MEIQRVALPTEVIECSCKFCAEYAEREGLTLPMRAEVNEKMIAATGKSAKVVHNLVRLAHQPTGGSRNHVIAEFGPWAVRA